jgi:membrane protein implicated in regulation of membrane protease activity
MVLRVHRSPLARYTAFQIPGWIIAAGGGWWAHRSLDVPVWLAAGVLAVWVIKDIVLYPVLRFAYETDDRLPIERLIGMRGTTLAALAPDGYVRVRGELWRARAEAGQSLARGEPVEIMDIDGTMFVVRRVTPLGNRESVSKSSPSDHD